ncbi:MAG: hypothetical protein ACFFC7_22525 [Candidatus Hermodarchaeota archaeon]
MNAASDQKSQFHFDPKLIPTVINTRRISKLDTSYSEDNYVILSTFGKNFRINEPMYNILRHVNGRRTLEELSTLIREQEGLDVNPEDLWNLLSNDLAPRGLISLQEDEIEQKYKSNSPFRIIVFPRNVQVLLSRLLANFVSLPILLVLIGSFIGLTIIINETKPVNNISSLDFFFVPVLFLIGILIHELGHSAAGIRGGVEPGGIGFRFLLWIPVFSIDLNDAWVLDRKSRVELNLGGVGLQSAYGILLLISSYLFKSSILFTASTITCSMILLNLMPFPGLDGYWVFSDVLGVPNLRKESIVLVKRIFLKKKTKEEPWGKISLHIKIFMLCYSLFTLMSFFFIIMLIQTFILRLVLSIITLPGSIEQIGGSLLEGRILDFLLQLIGFAFILIFLFGFIAMLVGFLFSFGLIFARFFSRIRKQDQ